MYNKHLNSSNSDEWTTPDLLFNDLNDEFHFTLDPCATSENHKVDKYYDLSSDGLSYSWDNEVVFCNPPYSQIKKWVKKAYYETIKGSNCLVVLLIPARTDTSYFHDYIYGKHEIRFIRGRLKFSNSKHNAPFPSMIVIMRPWFYEQ